LVLLLVLLGHEKFTNSHYKLIFRSFGILFEEYDSLFQWQGGKGWI